jgi:hypothetical protein
MIPGFGFIQGVIQIRKIAEEEKKIKAAKEKQRAKDWGAKSINLYAAMLAGVSKEELKDIYPIDDKKFIVTEEGLESVKVEPDITITQKQAKRWLKVIEDYSMSGECDFRDLNGVMGELSALIGDDDED